VTIFEGQAAIITQKVICLIIINIWKLKVEL